MQALHKCVLIIGSLLNLGVLAPLGYAETSESDAEKAWLIVSKADMKTRGFQDLSAKVTMKIIEPDGSENIRILNTVLLPSENEGDKSLTTFELPKDQSGTALLTHSNINSEDDRWLFMPVLKRVKRVNTQNLASPFFGSEFSFEDMAPPSISKYRYQYLREEGATETLRYIIERVPTYESAGYAKQIIAIDGDYLLRKVEFFDGQNIKQKTLTFDTYKNFENSYWRPHRLEMVNHENQRRTELVIDNYQFDQGLQELDFQPTTLTRRR